MKHLVLLICSVMLIGLLSGSVIDETLAIKGWLDTPFSSNSLEVERDGKLQEWQGLVKGEFETSFMFEKRKADAAARITAIREEYKQMINASLSVYEDNQNKLRQRLSQLVAASRETILMDGSLGRYDADTQKFTMTIPEKTFQIMVPLDQAPGVKQNIGSYELHVTRQLNEDLVWVYLEAKLVGSAGTFTSTD